MSCRETEAKAPFKSSDGNMDGWEKAPSVRNGTSDLKMAASGPTVGYLRAALDPQVGTVNPGYC